jgi:hypothetical protein
MAQSKRHGSERPPGHGGGQGGGHGGGNGGGQGGGNENEEGDDPRRHASIIQRRWLGSPLPTYERYALALRQWQALPGAVARSAANVIGAEPPAQPDTHPVPGEKE